MLRNAGKNRNESVIKRDEKMSRLHGDVVVVVD